MDTCSFRRITSFPNYTRRNKKKNKCQSITYFQLGSHAGWTNDPWIYLDLQMMHDSQRRDTESENLAGQGGGGGTRGRREKPSDQIVERSGIAIWRNNYSWKLTRVTDSLTCTSEKDLRKSKKGNPKPSCVSFRSFLSAVISILATSSFSFSCNLCIMMDFVYQSFNKSFWPARIIHVFYEILFYHYQVYLSLSFADFHRGGQGFWFLNRESQSKIGKQWTTLTHLPAL